MHPKENPFQYFKKFINEMEQFVDQEAKAHDAEHLGGPQGHVIMHLLNHPDQEFSFKDIEEALHLSKSVTSNLLKRMEKNGFIHIVPWQKDKRVKHIHLTEFGLARASNLKRFLEHVHEVLSKNISDEDFERTVKVIMQLKANIQEEQNKSQER